MEHQGWPVDLCPFHQIWPMKAGDSLARDGVMKLPLWYRVMERSRRSDFSFLMRLRGGYRFQAFHFDFPALGVVPKQGGILLFKFCCQRLRLIERDFQRAILAVEPQIGEAAANF